MSRYCPRRFDPRRGDHEILHCKLGVMVHHLPRHPAAKVLEFVAGCPCLPMPRCPGMPQVVNAKVLDPHSLRRAMPARVGESPPYRIASVREAVATRLSKLLCQHFNSIHKVQNLRSSTNLVERDTRGERLLEDHRTEVTEVSQQHDRASSPACDVTHHADARFQRLRARCRGDCRRRVATSDPRGPFREVPRSGQKFAPEPDLPRCAAFRMLRRGQDMPASGGAARGSCS